MDAKFQHGTGISYRRCTGGATGGPCSPCVLGKRAADSERQRASRAKRTGGVTTPSDVPTAVASETGKTARRTTKNVSHPAPGPGAGMSHPAGSGSAGTSHPAASGDAGTSHPAVLADAETDVPGEASYSQSQTVSDVPAYEMPRLWPTSASEPLWAGDHRARLADYVDKALAGESFTIVFDSDGITLPALKDWRKLTKEFIKANPDLIKIDPASPMKGFMFGAEYLSYSFESIDYVAEAGVIDGETDESADESDNSTDEFDGPEDGRARIYEPKPDVQIKTAPINTRPRAFFFASRIGICKVSIQGRMQCDNPADGRYEFRGWAVCRECFKFLKPHYPGECVQKRAGGESAPRFNGRYEIMRNTHGMCYIKTSADIVSCTNYVGYDAGQYTYTVGGYPACQNHYNQIREVNPGECRYYTRGEWHSAPLNIEPFKL